MGTKELRNSIWYLNLDEQYRCLHDDDRKKCMKRISPPGRCTIEANEGLSANVLQKQVVALRALGQILSNSPSSLACLSVTKSVVFVAGCFWVEFLSRAQPWRLVYNVRAHIYERTSPIRRCYALKRLSICTHLDISLKPSVHLSKKFRRPSFSSSASASASVKRLELSR